jgi:UDP-glucose 4-epimerase
MTVATEREWYTGRRVLAIGGLGYIGSNLVEALLASGADVTVVTPERDRHLPDASRVGLQGVRLIEADVRDLRAMRSAVRGQEVVFNVAGRSGAVQSVEDPTGDLDVNCAGSLAVLEAIRFESPTAKLVFAGSRLVYGRTRVLPVGEDHPLEPLCPHGVHKAVVEQYLSIYGRLHGVRATTLRITNPYGPGQPRDRSAYGVINYLIHRALSGLPLTIFGDGTQLRDYLFIDDLVRALLVVGADPRSDGRVYNVGSGVGTRMIDAARLILDAVGMGRVESQPWPVVAQQIETGDFVADIARIERELGWRPLVTLIDGLRLAVTSYHAASQARS